MPPSWHASSGAQTAGAAASRRRAAASPEATHAGTPTPSSHAPATATSSGKAATARATRSVWPTRYCGSPATTAARRMRSAVPRPPRPWRGRGERPLRSLRRTRHTDHRRSARTRPAGRSGPGAGATTCGSKNVNAFAVSPASVATRTPDASGNGVVGRQGQRDDGRVRHLDVPDHPGEFGHRGLRQAAQHRRRHGEHDGVERGVAGSRRHHPAVDDAGQRGDSRVRLTRSIARVRSSR